MTPSTRAFFLTGLLALAGAAILHFLVLWGLAVVWYPAIHLTIFGWITAMILGVNYHTVPVFAARDFPYPWLGKAHWVTFTGGIALTTGALLVGSPVGTAAGIILEITAALLFTANTLLLFLRGPQRPHRPPAPPIPIQPAIDRISTMATKGAGLSLPLALVLLLAVYRGWLGATWILAAEHLAVLGWVMLMIAGVAYHVLPRFSGRSVRGLNWARAQLLCHYGALALMVPSLGFGWTSVFAVGGVLMTLAVGLFAWTVWPALSIVRPRQGLVQVSFKEARR